LNRGRSSSKTAELKAAPKKVGVFDGSHSIFYGVNNLHEGITICHPVNIHKDF
jgi:hypothetical protein